MQTTLLGLAGAIILALVAALVGPLCVDWGRWRTAFETEATRLVGMPVRVSGRIDARLLPTPSLLLNGIAVGSTGQAGVDPRLPPKLRARTLRVEFALGALMRGEWRAAELHLDGPEITLGLGADGRVDVPAVSIGFDPDQLAFDRVAIEDGRAVLLDAASDTRVVLDRLSFKGDVRSLLGPFKGEGAFESSGQRYGYRIAGSRRGDDGGMRLRLNVDPSDRPLTIETDGTLRVERGHPRFDGNLALARPAGFALSNGTTLASEPWRATSRIAATPKGALLEQLDFQYGPDEHAIKLVGTAELTFGAKPSFDGVLSARQIDLDRALLMPDAVRRTPVALLRHMTDTLTEFARPPIPVKIGIGIDSLTLGGGSLVALRGDLLAEKAGWSVDSLEFRAPGATQVRASGRLTLASGASGFDGPASLDSADPRTFIAWLEGRPDAPRGATGALRARGDVMLGAERLAVERLRAEFERKSIEGRLAYAFATDRRPASLDAAISAAEIDLDGAFAFASGALAGTTLERPGDVALALDFGRTSFAGIEAKGAKANLKFDRNGLVVERLAIADFGGVILDASGRIDTASASPRGSLTLALEAQRLTGVAALAARFVPRAVDPLNSLTQRGASARLSAKLDVAPVSAAPDAKTAAKLTLDGAIAGMRVNLRAEADGDMTRPAAAAIRLDGRLDTNDGAALAALAGLDRLVTLAKLPTRLTFAASGPANGDLGVDVKFDGAGLTAAARGTLRLADARPQGALDVTVAAADARLPRRDPAAAVPVTLATRVALDGDRLSFEGLDGKVAGAAVKGRLALTLGQPTRVEGKLDADTVDAMAVLAAAIGAPAGPPRGVAWSSEPFGTSPLLNMDGRLDVSAARAILAPGIAARQLRATVRIDPGAIALEKIEGSVGEGRFAAQIGFHAASPGLSAQAHVSLTNADLAALMPRAAFGQVAGRVSLQFDVAGAGLSPAALVGALQGSGNATAESLQLSGLDPRAIDAAVQAADRGMPLERIGDAVRGALDSGRLNIPDVGGAIAIGDGRVTLGPIATLAQGADVAISGSYGLGEDALDLRFALTGAARSDMSRRPELAIALKGPLDAPRRTVDTTVLVNWLASRAVALEAKRLEAAEREAKRIQAEEEARRAQEAAQRAQEAERRAQEAAKQEAAKQEAAKQEAVRREQEAAQRAQEAAREAARREQEAAMPTASTGAPASNKAPDLPPTIEIAPLPAGPDRRPRYAPPPSDRASTAVPGAPLTIAPPVPR